MEIKKGCLIEAFENGHINMIAHQVNCQRVMNSGVAKAIREKYPEHFADYTLFVDQNDYDYLLGQVVTTETEDGLIFGVFGQQRYGYDGNRYTNYVALAQGLFEAAGMGCGPRKIGVPYNIGCDRGGGDWNIVQEIITDIERIYNNVEFVAYRKFGG